MDENKYNTGKLIPETYPILCLGHVRATLRAVFIFLYKINK